MDTCFSRDMLLFGVILLTRRNMFRHQFISVVDIDEIVVPTKHDTYQEMIAHLKKTKKLDLNKYSFMFHSSNYFLEYNSDPDISPRLPWLRHREYVDTPGLRVKSFENPRRCQRINSHGCETGSISPVSYDVGRVHHYRATCYSSNNPALWSHGACAKLANKTAIDSNTLRFYDKLSARVNQVYERLKLDVK